MRSPGFMHSEQWGMSQSSGSSFLRLVSMEIGSEWIGSVESYNEKEEGVKERPHSSVGRALGF